MWSKPLLCRFRQLKKIPQTQVLQGFPAFRHAPPWIQPRHSQTRRDTNFAIPGYLILNYYSTKAVRWKYFFGGGHSCGKSGFLSLAASRGNSCFSGLPGVSRTTRGQDRRNSKPSMIQTRLSHYSRSKCTCPVPYIVLWLRVLWLQNKAQEKLGTKR